MWNYVAENRRDRGEDRREITGMAGSVHPHLTPKGTYFLLDDFVQFQCSTPKCGRTAVIRLVLNSVGSTFTLAKYVMQGCELNIQNSSLKWCLSD